MASEFTMTRRVEFAETDMAGIMHFSNFFKFMEAAEHAFYRSLGFSVDSMEFGPRIGWPRVRAACDFRKPLRFEDEVEVQLRVREKRRRSIRYDFVFRKGGEEVARGSSTVVCVSMGDTGEMNAIEIPPAISSRIDEAPAEPADVEV